MPESVSLTDYAINETWYSNVYGTGGYGQEWLDLRTKILALVQSGKTMYVKVTKTKRTGTIYRISKDTPLLSFQLDEDPRVEKPYGPMTDEIASEFLKTSSKSDPRYPNYPPVTRPKVYIKTNAVTLEIDDRRDVTVDPHYPRYMTGWKKDMVLLFDYDGPTVFQEAVNHNPFEDWSIVDRFGATIQIGDAITAVHATSSRSGSVESIFGKLVGFSKYKCPIVRDVLTGQEVTLRNCKPEKMVRLDKSLMDRIMMAKLKS